MNHDVDIIRRLLGPHYPAAGVCGTQGTVEAAERIAAAAAPVREPAVRLHARGNRRLLLAAGPVAAGIAAIAVAAGLLATSGPTVMRPTPRMLAFETRSDTAGVRQILLRMAASAARQPSDIGSGKYLYTETSNWWLYTGMNHRPVAGTGPGSAAPAGVSRACAGDSPELIQQWTAADGSGRVVNTTRIHIPASCGMMITRPPVIATTYGPGRLRLRWPDPLSGNPQALLGQLAAGLRSGSGAIAVQPGAVRLGSVTLGSVALITAVSDLYGEQPVRPAVRAAILKLIARLPGLRYAGASSDRAGRPGIGVSVDSASSGRPMRYLLILSPVTGQLLDSEQILTADGAAWEVRTPSVTAYTVYLTSGRRSEF